MNDQFSPSTVTLLSSALGIQNGGLDQESLVELVSRRPLAHQGRLWVGFPLSRGEVENALRRILWQNRSRGGGLKQPCDVTCFFVHSLLPSSSLLAIDHGSHNT